MPGNDYMFISSRSYDISGTVKDSAVFINENGSFETKLSQAFDGDLALIFD